MKLHLQSTDYGNFLANEPSPLAVSTMDEKLREKLVIEFQHIRTHATEPLATFLDYITYAHYLQYIRNYSVLNVVHLEIEIQIRFVRPTKN